MVASRAWPHRVLDHDLHIARPIAARLPSSVEAVKRWVPLLLVAGTAIVVGVLVLRACQPSPEAQLLEQVRDLPGVAAVTVTAPDKPNFAPAQEPPTWHMTSDGAWQPQIGNDLLNAAVSIVGQLPPSTAWPPIIQLSQGGVSVTVSGDANAGEIQDAVESAG
jgi:hypothetical protein